MAKGGVSIYIVAPAPRAHQDLGILDLKFFWKNAAVKSRWNTIVKDARALNQLLEMIKPRAKALTVNRIQLAIIAISRTGDPITLNSPPMLEQAATFLAGET